MMSDEDIKEFHNIGKKSGLKKSNKYNPEPSVLVFSFYQILIKLLGSWLCVLRSYLRDE